MNPSLDCKDGVCVLSPPPEARVARPAPEALAPETFAARLAASSLPVLVDFSAASCGPCGWLDLVLPKLVAEFDGRLEIVQLDCDKARALSEAYAIEVFPTLVGFVAGVELARRSGFVIEEHGALRDWIADIVAEASGTPAPPMRGEADFDSAVLAAKAAHDVAVLPLLEAVVEAQAPHLPAHQADFAAIMMEHREGRIDDRECDRRTSVLAERFAGLVDEPRRRLDAALEPANTLLESTIRIATIRFAEVMPR